MNFKCINHPSVKGLFKQVGVASAVAAVILISEYFVGNWIGFLFDDSSLLSVFNILRSISDDNDDRDITVEEEDEDVRYFNVGYDKELVSVGTQRGVDGKYRDSIGSAVVTNRKILLKLLEIAERSNYRFLFLDVRFEKGKESILDSMLFSKIKSMRDIVVSTHQHDDHYEIADTVLLPKAAYADYVTTYFSGFNHYSYLQNDSVSVALRMFDKINGGNLKRIGPFYFSSGHLCNNMQFLTFREKDIIDTKDEYSVHPAFGGETLKVLSEDEIINSMNGKIVVVGDMVDDLHNTYAGVVAGPVLNIRAYQALVESRHLIDWKLVLFLFLVYSACAYWILYAHNLKITDRLRKRLNRHPLVLFLLLNIGWGLLMYIVKLIAFVSWNASVIIAIPAFIFSALSMPDSYVEFKKRNDDILNNKEIINNLQDENK